MKPALYKVLAAGLLTAAIFGSQPASADDSGGDAARSACAAIEPLNGPVAETLERQVAACTVAIQGPDVDGQSYSRSEIFSYRAKGECLLGLYDQARDDFDAAKALEVSPNVADRYAVLADAAANALAGHPSDECHEGPMPS